MKRAGCKSNRILVIGGTGYIGRVLFRRLLASGYDAHVMSRNAKNFARRFPEHYTRAHSGDIEDAASISQVIDRLKPRIIYFLVGTTYDEGKADPARAIRYSSVGALNVFSVALHAGCERVVLSSSSAVYRPSRRRACERKTPMAPTDMVGVNKAMLEELAQFFARTTHMTVVVARLFSVYGPCHRSTAVIQRIVDQMRNGPLVRLHNPDVWRDFIYIEDAAEALLNLGRVRLRTGAVVNIGSGRQRSLRTIVCMVARLLGRKAQIQVSGSIQRATDRRYSVADISKLKRLRLISKPTPMEVGLRLVLEHTK